VSVPPSEASPGPRNDPAEPPVFRGSTTAAFPLSESLGGACGGAADPTGVDNVLPSTTRWKPQKDTTQNVDIYFEYRGSGSLKRATATITGPSPVAPVTVPFWPGAGNPYKITWAGPWTTDSANPASYLARGDYKIVVTAVKEDDTTVETGPTDPNGKVSLVEVTSVRLEQAGGPGLDNNPGPCPQPPSPNPNCTVPASGKRIFAEARDPVEVNPNAPVYDKVNVTATIDPPVSDLRGQAPVKVHFRPLDVDDPAPQGLIDDETKLRDNRGPQASLTDEDGVEILNAYVVALPVTGSEARTVLRVAWRQGDNYRVAASTSSPGPRSSASSRRARRAKWSTLRIRRCRRASNSARC
jgi:hypothetical protein